MKPSATKMNPARPEGKTAKDALKVLLYDVESSPNIGICWGRWDQNIIEFVKERQIISFAWKWLGEKDVHVMALPSFKGYARFPESNRSLIRKLHRLFGEAAIVIGHNVDEFDDKMANTDFIKNGLPPPPPHKTIDTLKVARKYFRFNSNSLGDLGVLLKLGKKVKHPGISMWLKCLDGDAASWELMKKYNQGDVTLLEKVYLTLRPWMENHPSVSAFEGNVCCSKCGGKNLRPKGRRIVSGGWKRRFKCRDCGGYARGEFRKDAWRFS